MQHKMADRDRQTVLVIEDDLWLRRMLADLLAGEGYEAVQASNGQTGLRLAALERPSLVVLDLALPELSGLDVLAALEQEPATQGVPVLVMSGHAGLLAEANRRHVAGILPKPFAPDELLGCIAGAMAARCADHPLCPVAPPHRAPAPRAHRPPH